ncbi:hypothetical protein MASR1M97_19170 [Candidatus Desulfobacillus denitrificans]
MIPKLFQGRMSVPVIAAPMFLVSGPHLVIETCKAGIAGTFPTLNARPIEVLDEWLTQINAELGAAMAANPQAPVAPYGVNLILHHSNTRLAQDFELVVKHKVPFVITSLGHPGEVVKAVHGYGGVVFSDVIHAYHAKKAIDAGVDGIVCVAAGAGATPARRAPSRWCARSASSGAVRWCSAAPSPTAPRCARRKSWAPTSPTWARASSPRGNRWPPTTTSGCSSTAP